LHSGITRGTAAEGAARPTAHGVRRYADLVIIGVLLVAVAVLLVRQSQFGPAAPRGTAIAVLPFENLSTAGEGEVLASGIAESVLHQLASLAELDVISRTSSFAFRGRATDAREIGRQLGARYLLLLQDPRIQELLRETQEHIAAERRELDRMRREGLVPKREDAEPAPT
jgi:hypothetical protein